MTMTNEFCVRMVPLPADVHGITVFDADGFANIYINIKDSCETQSAALQHELAHVKWQDGYNDIDINAVES